MSAVAILPNHIKLGLRPARLPLDAMFWPLGQPDALKGGQLGDLGAQDDLICFPSKSLHIRPSFGTRARVSIMVLEPEAIHAHHMQRLRRSHRRFHRVLSSNRALLDAIPNGIFFPLGHTWVENWRDLDLEKHKMCSLIASAKRSETGHALRHSMADWVRDTGKQVDVMGGGYARFEEKSDGLAPYRYSIVIENVQEPDYFTEKLIDAILCDSIPIYWGCPNIADFFDPDALIACQSEAELRAAVDTMSEQDFDARLPKLRAQKDRAAFWGDLYGRAARAIAEDGPGQMP